MKKIVAIVAGVLTACILLSGIFSAGIVVGNRVVPGLFQESKTTQPVGAEPPAANDADSGPGDLTPGQADDSSPAASLPDVPPPPDNLEDLFVPFWEAWDIVHEQYVDQPVDDDAMMRGAIQGMLSSIDDTVSIASARIPGTDEYLSQSGTPAEVQELFMPFWENWALAHSPDDQALMQGAISGMLESLGDQHTSYMNPDQFTQANIPLDGTYEGIGAWVDPNMEYLTIVSPMTGSPAEAAGLLPGDEIIAVDGDDMTGVDGNLVIRRVLGPAHSKVVLTIRREGVEEPFDVEITRAKIAIPSLEARMLDDDVAYIHLFTFGEDTKDELRTALKDLLAQKPVGLVFDLRNNGGGYLVSAIEVASEFIDDGVIMYEEYGDGSRDTYEALGHGLATDLPMVVLINEGTASASEIVSGAIQDYGRAPLVGVTSFGKGSVQNWIPLSNNQGAVRVTIARWLTPNERQIHQIGLEPDYPIIGVSQAAIDDGFDIDSLGMEPDQIVILSAEDVQAGKDPQLDKAIEVLLNR
jgi:carboxyl-terminal processing protease